MRETGGGKRIPDPGCQIPDLALAQIGAVSGIWHLASLGYSGNARPFVSGANQIRIMPKTYTKAMVSPAAA